MNAAYVLALVAMFGVGYWARGADNKPPAPGGGLTPGPVRHAREMPPRLPAQVPGQDPARPHDASQAAAPGPSNPAVFHITSKEWACGCVRVTNHLARRHTWTRCARHRKGGDWVDATLARILDET